MKGRGIRIAAAIAIAGTWTANAQNPIIHDQFTADPTARVFEGKMYLYPSHDIPSPVERLEEWFCMADYHVFSSFDLTDWEDHGVILTQDSIPWVEPGSYAMWAPDCVSKNGKYYFYFPAAPKGHERGFSIGVAVADSPAGPFTPLDEPIEGVRGIDPCVLIDDDGRSYIFWSGMGLSGAPLADDMTHLAGTPVKIEGLPEGFKEGPFAFKREGRYYLTFPWVREKEGTETLAYAMSDLPLGPYEFKGIIMDESPTGCWTNHHSIVDYEGDWYLFYHHNDYSPEMDKRRSARIDRISFNADGSINKVTPTLRGVGVTDARRHIELDRYSAISPDGAAIDFINPDNKFEGWKTILKDKDAWVRYDRVDFGSKPAGNIGMRVRSRGGASLKVAAGDPDRVIATVTIPATGEEWMEISSPVEYSPAGIADLTVTLCYGSSAEIDWAAFDL
ncbi:MAG: family 43 glycosylhydrolase [Muribaculaceae bacterium]|nr:family 43 glycosylhydrolase [Muribaculaceae bacterium]